MLDDLTRHEIKSIKKSVSNTLKAYKENLTKVVDRIKTTNVPTTLLDKLGLDAGEKTELATFRTDITEIRDFITSKGF